MTCCSSTVAEWGEACTETHRAHSPWEGWRGKRSFQPFLTNEKLGYTPPTVLTVPPRDISHDWAFCLCLFVTETVQRFSDSVWHHPSQQRPGQSAPRAFPAGSPVDCAGIVSQRWLLQACFSPLSATCCNHEMFIYYPTGRSPWNSCCRICFQQRVLTAV